MENGTEGMAETFGRGMRCRAPAKMMERNGAEWIDGSSEEQIEEELSTNFIFDVSLATSSSRRLRKTLPTIRRVQ